ncbi:uncharacterized protein LOC113398561 [Vanessa tameamea]|uniref:Uncharacterized protein LOC113398561 n=1 Tax=Vanessa tameamea TaxID=334116 RepID=A0A8B8IA83_VANTA|nr:uncharacterized protein LOC113398561 [Vanessa tameamea]
MNRFIIFLLSAAFIVITIQTADFQDNLINGYRTLIADIQVRTQKSREDMDTLVSQIKLLMKNEADKAINYMTIYLEQISMYFQVIIHDRKPRNGTYCKESIVKLLGENLQLADENVTLCLALGYQRVQRLPEKLQVHFETLENLKKYSASKLFECQKQQQVGGNCSHESQDLERTVFLYETSPFPVVMAEIAIHGFKEVSDLSVCLKDIISRMMTHSVKVIGDFNRCIHNIEMPKLKYLLKFMKKYA